MTLFFAQEFVFQVNLYGPAKTQFSQEVDFKEHSTSYAPPFVSLISASACKVFFHTVRE